MQLLGCLFSFIFIIFIFLFVALKQTFRTIFGLNQNSQKQNRRKQQKTTYKQNKSTSEPKKKKGKKIFDDEGEYVDYEEIK